MKTILTLFLFLGLINSAPSYASSPSENCKFSGNSAKSWALKRGNGKSVPQVLASIDQIAADKGLSADDVEMAKFMVNLVYVELKDYSPNQVERFVYRSCMDAAR